MTRYGYAAMNVTLRDEDVRTNRGMRQATFEQRGVEYAGELGAQNCRDLKRIIEWNLDHDIHYYRITSDLLPWFSRYDLDDLPNATRVRDLLADIGTLARNHDIRLTFHPNHFVKLASPDEGVVERSLIDLENHGVLLDTMGLSRSPYNAINIHVGAHYDDKAATGERFCDHYRQLSPAVRTRLTVENDDTESLWSIPELIESVYDRIGVPITYDDLHHQFTDRGLTRREALVRAVGTWDAKPIIHYSEPRRLHETDSSIRPQNHSDYIAGPIDTYGTNPDVMIEAKAKERAVLRYRSET
jgi:UV DNA damage endonuclease